MSTLKDKVLVVDDEKIVCQSCEDILEEEGFSVTTVLSGEECLNLINERRYDAVVLDLKIPDINGMEILKVIKEKMPHASVIIITGYSSLQSAIEAMKLGASDYIAKPFTPDELSLSLKEALKKRAVIAGEGDIVQAFIKKDELDEDIRKLEYSVWNPVPFKPAYFSEWMGARIGKDGTARIILNDLFFKLKGKVKFIDFPQIGEQIDTDTPSFRIFYTSNESSSIQMEEVCSPVSGKVIELNSLAVRRTNVVNEDPFHSGWLIRVAPSRFIGDIEGLKLRKILIADDDKIARESLIKYFQEDIYYIYHTANLQDLAEGVKNRRYDVAILGKNVHGTPVYTAAKYIRDVDKNLPIIVLTEDYSLELTVKVREHNIFFHALKPLDETEIELAVRNAFVKTELTKRIVEKPHKFGLSRVIKSIGVVNRSGKHIAIIGIGNVFNKDNCIGQNLVDRLKKMNLPVNLDMGSRELLGKEILPYIERNDKIIIINGIEMVSTPGKVKKFSYNSFTNEQHVSIEHKSKQDFRINQIGYPEIVNWINAVGMETEVGVIGIQTNKCGYGNERFCFSMEQNEEIIDEILSEVLS